MPYPVQLAVAGGLVALAYIVGIGALYYLTPGRRP